MNARCKPGDLAIIMYDEPQCTANIGRIVEVSGPPAYDIDGHLTWLIQPVTPEPYLINNRVDAAVRFMEWQEYGIEHRDDRMLPIRQEPKLEEVVERTDLPVEVE